MARSLVALSALLLLSFITCISADPSSTGAGGGAALDPPGLLPLINTANALLSAGQFGDAVKAYSEAIGPLFLPPFPKCAQ